MPLQKPLTSPDQMRLVSISDVSGKGVPQIRFQFLPLPLAADPNGAGIYGYASVEMPNSEITLPPVPAGGTQHYSAFTPSPDFVVVLGNRDGEMGQTYCSGSTASTFQEYSHIQIAAVLRDLGVENDTATVRDTAFGWGLQLSGGYAVPRKPGQCQFPDIASFGITYGKGIARYFDDLSLVNPVNDAIESTTLTPLEVFGFYAGYTHNWNDCWRSTAAYSHLELHDVPNAAAFASYYNHGDYASVNLIFHLCKSSTSTTDGKATTAFHQLFVGGEADYGQKQDVAGSYGDDFRFMLMIGATK